MSPVTFAFDESESEDESIPEQIPTTELSTERLPPAYRASPTVFGPKAPITSSLHQVPAQHRGPSPPQSDRPPTSRIFPPPSRHPITSSHLFEEEEDSDHSLDEPVPPLQYSPIPSFSMFSESVSPEPAVPSTSQLFHAPSPPQEQGEEDVEVEEPMMEAMESAPPYPEPEPEVIPKKDEIENHLITCICDSILSSVDFSSHPVPLAMLKSPFVTSNLCKSLSLMFKGTSYSTRLPKVISLISTLWGISSENSRVLFNENDYTANDYRLYHQRIRDLSSWCGDVLSNQSIVIDDETVRNNSVLANIFTNILRGNILKATALSLEKFPEIAPLITSSRSGESRPLIVSAVNNMTDSHPLFDLFPILAILAGDVSMTVGNDWLVAFACYLWYNIEPGTKIVDLVSEFCTLIDQGIINSPKNEENHSIDIIFNLIKSFSGEPITIQKLHNPWSFNDEPRNFFSVFVTHILLSGLGILNQEIPLEVCFNLEKLGLWRWAVCAALFHPNDSCRSRIVGLLISRNVKIPEVIEFGRFSENDDILFLTKKLNISKEFVFKSISVKARSIYTSDLKLGSFLVYATSLFLASEFSTVHSLLIGSLGAELLSAKQISIQQAALNLLSAYSNKIDSWNNGGFVILTLLELYESLHRYSQSFSVTQIQDFEQKLFEVVRHLSSWNSCVTTLTKRTTRMSRFFINLLADLVSQCRQKLNELARDSGPFSIEDFDTELAFVGDVGKYSVRNGLKDSLILADQILFLS
ncbi:hypothetical protein P9112_007264 [Eukaryota sp. TZLM1-RC]